jgi:hypothetical protein
MYYQTDKLVLHGVNDSQSQIHIANFDDSYPSRPSTARPSSARPSTAFSTTPLRPCFLEDFLPPRPAPPVPCGPPAKWPAKDQQNCKEQQQQQTQESSDLNPDDIPDGGRQAWLVATGAAAILFCTLGYANSFGVFQAHYMLNQLEGTSPDSISWIGSVQIFLVFATGMIGGPFFDRYGAWVSSIPIKYLIFCLTSFFSLVGKERKPRDRKGNKRLKRANSVIRFSARQEQRISFR